MSDTVTVPNYVIITPNNTSRKYNSINNPESDLLTPFVVTMSSGTSGSCIYQDNKSAILLERNGQMSSSKRTKHFKNKIFFVHDRVEHGEVAIEYCPTKQMWTDANTKPKQGTPFCLDRSKMLNCPVRPSQAELTGEGGIAPQ